MRNVTSARSLVRRIVLCAATPLVIPALVYSDLVRRLGVMPVHVRGALRTWTVRLGISVAVVAFILSLITCVYITVRRAKRVGVVQAVAGDVGLAVAFVVAPWCALLIGGSPPGEIISLWVGPGALMRALPSICAAIAGLAFVTTTPRVRRPEAAV